MTIIYEQRNTRVDLLKIIKLSGIILNIGPYTKTKAWCVENKNIFLNIVAFDRWCTKGDKKFVQFSYSNQMVNIFKYVHSSSLPTKFFLGNLI